MAVSGYFFGVGLGAVLVVQSENGGFEFFEWDGGREPLKVCVDIAMGDRSRDTRKADELPPPTDPVIGVENLCADAINLRCRRNFKPEPLVLVSLFLVLGAGPLPAPAIRAQDFPDVSSARASARSAMSVPVLSENQ